MEQRVIEFEKRVNDDMREKLSQLKNLHTTVRD